MEVTIHNSKYNTDLKIEAEDDYINFSNNLGDSIEFYLDDLDKVVLALLYYSNNKRYGLPTLEGDIKAMGLK